MSLHFSLAFPYAFGLPTGSGDFRWAPEDFGVDESLGFDPVGSGEHVYLQVKKCGENTAWVAEHIARLAGVKINDVSYSGRKDRHAVTTQWFSVYLPKQQEPDWRQLNSDSVTLLDHKRHTHKLRRGEHDENHFVIRLRNIDSPVSDVELRLKKIAAQGVPNYFGEQRFGLDGNNLRQAHELLVEKRRIRDRQKKGLLLSAARSWLFNQVLAERVQRNDWHIVLEGDMNEGPSGPLWGRGRSMVLGETIKVESNVLGEWTEWCEALEHVGLQQERRHLILKPRHLTWRWITPSDLELSFSLGSGEFATAILREIIQLRSLPASHSSES